MGDINGEGKGKDGWGEMKFLKNLGWIESGGGSSLMFVVEGVSRGKKNEHGHFTLRCVIYCDNRIWKYLLLEIRKGVYAISST